MRLVRIVLCTTTKCSHNRPIIYVHIYVGPCGRMGLLYACCYALLVVACALLTVKQLECWHVELAALSQLQCVYKSHEGPENRHDLLVQVKCPASNRPAPCASHSRRVCLQRPSMIDLLCHIYADVWRLGLFCTLPLCQCPYIYSNNKNNNKT